MKILRTNWDSSTKTNSFKKYPSDHLASMFDPTPKISSRLIRPVKTTSQFRAQTIATDTSLGVPSSCFPYPSSLINFVGAFLRCLSSSAPGTGSGKRHYKGIWAVAAPLTFCSTALIALLNALYDALDFRARASWMQQWDNMIRDSGMPHCCVAVNVDTARGNMVGSA